MHTHFTPMIAHTPSSTVYSRATGERGGPRQCDSNDRQTWWRRGLKQHVVSFLLRGNLCALFKVPTPLRWKILRFPNVTQCAVQLTTHVCWLLDTHIHRIYTYLLTYLTLWAKEPAVIATQREVHSKKIYESLQLFLCLLRQWWTSLFVSAHAHSHTPTVHIWVTVYPYYKKTFSHH